MAFFGLRSKAIVDICKQQQLRCNFFVGSGGCLLIYVRLDISFPWLGENIVLFCAAAAGPKGAPKKSRWTLTKSPKKHNFLLFLLVSKGLLLI